MKKILVLALALVMSMSLVISAAAAETGQVDSLLKTVDAQEKDDAYYEALLDACIYNNKVIRNYPFVYEDESWHDYRRALNKAVKIENVDEDAKAVLDAAQEAQDALVQIASVDETALKIWGDVIPCSDDPDALIFDAESWDVPEFEPFLVPYILEDQTDVKGNIILVSGGGYDHRANDSEGYVIAPLFNEMGYNVFVLQRRVAPYSQENCWMDLQRSIRYIRYNQETLGLGTDYVILNGYSGGGRTVSGTIQTLYGDIQPTIYDPNYIPDEVDAVNADANVAAIIYGSAPLEDPETGETFYSFENPNYPALFIAVGADDGAMERCIRMAQEANEYTMVDLHVFGNTGHGFGKGLPKSNSVYWMEMLDNFVSIDKVTKK